MAKNKSVAKSALHVMPGIDPPSSVNPDAISRMKNLRRRGLTMEEYVDGILSGNRTILGQSLTLIESSLSKDHDLAQKVIDQCLPHSGKSIRIGITGVPGVGKSTFIEVFGNFLSNSGKRVAVLAVDPSSVKSRGSILGDKTRMENLSSDPNAFIRPSPSGGSLGGVARKTRESIILCEAAGYDVIIIETVGVGQSETAVHSMTDFFLLLMLAGAGDELQGIKRGIMEMADLIAINKADGGNESKANHAKAEYQHALQLFPPTPSGWKPSALTCSAYTGKGVDVIWEKIQEYRDLTAHAYFMSKRSEQAKYWMLETVNEQLKNNFYGNHTVSSLLQELEKDVVHNKISPFMAAKKLLDIYKLHRE
jgi:LAO/AO transport system kinase